MTPPRPLAPAALRVLRQRSSDQRLSRLAVHARCSERTLANALAGRALAERACKNLEKYFGGIS